MLSDKNKRAVYDQYGEEGLKGGGPPPGGAGGAGGFPGGAGFGGFPGGGGTTFSFSTGGPGGGGFRPFHPSNAEDIFSQFFSAFGGPGGGGGGGGFRGMDDDDDYMMGGGGMPGGMGGMGGMPGGFGRSAGGRPSSRQQAQKPPAIKRPLPISLEDLYTGTKKRLKVTRKLRDASTGRPVQTDKILTIDVKPGWKAGTKIRFPGEGDEMPNGEAQDIEFVVEEKPHPLFKREGDNLRTTIELSLSEALSGFKRQIKTLDGRTLSVSNANSVIQPGQVSRVPREGMPNSKTGQKGDLLVEYKVKFPTSLTPAQKEAIKNALG